MIGPALLLVSVLDMVRSEVMPTALWNVDTPVPFNIASYSMLTLMIAQVCDLKPGDFVHTLGDAHLYLNHLEQVEEQLSRTPKKLPVMKITKDTDNIFDLKYEDFSLEEYNPDPHISAPVAV